MSIFNFLKKDDYEEPRCPLNKPNTPQRIPTSRVIKKLDEYLDANDYEWAQKHLNYWLEEARIANDNDGLLTILNEQVGLYRKLLKEEEGLDAAEEAIQVAYDIGLDDTVTMGTTLINAATAYKAFGKPDEAIALYTKARRIYEFYLDKDDEKLAGLYNNMAVTLIELEEYDEAEELFNKAIDVMAMTDQGEIEMAITYCNLADLHAANLGMEDGEKKISECLDKAEELLNTEGIDRNGYYAYVCEKCAPVFSYYGFFFVAQDLEQRAKEIYERA